VSEQTAHSKNEYRLRAKLPQYFRIGAIGGLAIAMLAVVIGFYRERSKTPFKLRAEHTQLSTDVVADVNGYERLETDGGIPKYYIKADAAKTFSDDHQELQNVYIETYDNDGAASQKMTAHSALYVPEPNKNFTAYLKGDVQIETADALKIKTNNVVYTKAHETAEADEAVEFERDTVRGTSFGALVNLDRKMIELQRDVEIEAFESPELVKTNIRYARINTASATFDRSADRIDLRDNVSISIDGKSNGKPQTSDVHAGRASVYFSGSDTSSSQLKKFELFDNVQIRSSEAGGLTTSIDAGYALFDKDADRYELKNAAHIVTSVNGQLTDITASEAVYEQSAGKITLTNGEITQGENYLRGELLNGNLFPDRKLKDAVARGSAVARQTTAERTATISAPELNATFSESHQLHDANAIGQGVIEIIPNNSSEYSRVTLSAVRGIGVSFKGTGLIDAMRSDGRTTIHLSPPDSADAASKRLTADVVKTTFAANGKDLSRAEAVGNAELHVEPLHAAPKNFITTTNAPRFECDFFAGNNAKTCTATRKTKTVRVPTVAEQGHGPQTLLADQLTADFGEQLKDIDQLKASGRAKFTELDHNAVAAEITYTRSDETVRFRGGEPTGWDSKYRAKAPEIDWDTRAQHSYLRGGVSTTYYNLKQIDKAAPFGDSDKPVFVTSQNAEFDQPSETAVYTGNARAWQENNYVRGDKFTMKQREGQFIAEGNVQSAAYNINTKSSNSSTPVFASADAMTYSRDDRLIRYRSNVDIRQGTDRITTNSADVYLAEDNSVSKTVAETNIVVTQPGRRGTGDWLQYTAADEMTILRGDPAIVEDAENGRSQAAQLTLYMREKRVVADGKTKPHTSRNKSVYTVQTK